MRLPPYCDTASFEARRPDVFVNFCNGASEDWDEKGGKKSNYICFAGKKQGGISYSEKEKYDRQLKKYIDLKEKYITIDYIPTPTQKTESLADMWRSDSENGADIHSAEEIDEIDKILKNYVNLMTNSISKSQAKNILRDTLKKLERFNEKTGFIETEEREQIYDYLSSCFKDKWYDELEEILSAADF